MLRDYVSDPGSTYYLYSKTQYAVLKSDSQSSRVNITKYLIGQPSGGYSASWQTWRMQIVRHPSFQHPFGHRPNTLLRDMSTPLLVPRVSLQHLRTSIQLNTHLQALRNVNLRTSVRYASGKSIGDKRERDQPKKKKKSRIVFKQYDLKNAEQFSLCDAMRYELAPLRMGRIIC